ncbi:MAG: mannose-1-phosphate guanylyltransferase/mannose-6-phosphate isomerase [Nitrospirae bacterium]|nr:mannose-1-phosphate guanylyltransferase/mannose-6-phosphate isomerase [Nitrospirota bacterium]
MERGGEIKIHPILLAGGTGTRLWPVSRELFPKQLVNLVGDESLIQNTIKRLSPTVELERLKIVCGKEHFFEIARHLEALGISSEGKIITEPCGRNTAPAILLAILNILKTEEDAVMLVFPSDHVIKDLQGFHERLEAAVRLAEKDHIVTFGIKPDRPETGYGYIEGEGTVEEGALKVKRFVEKPDLETAKDYLSKGNFFWNSGMFAFKASVMVNEFAAAEPGLLNNMRAILSGNAPVSMDSYAALPNISIDYAIMEKTMRGVVLPSDFGWSDIGTWETLYNFLPKDSDDNVVEGDVILKDTKHSFVRGGSRLVVVTGLENVVVIDTPDTVFISDLEKSRDVKNIVAELKEKGREEYKSHATVYRPWGTYTILEEMEGTKIKRIVVYPGAKLSLQMHHHRNEHWVVVSGTAKIINGDRTIILKENQSTYVPKESRHRLENPGKEPLHLIEVQMGGYLGEDDIVRFDDDFGRE